MGEGSGGVILIASNRGPVSFRLEEDGQLSTQRGGGGLVSGLSSVADHGNSLWVCAALSEADRSAARSAPEGRLSLDGKPGGSQVRLLDIPRATFQRAYNSVANSTLWFVHHMLYNTPSQPNFGMAFLREWESFRAYNRAFADALAQEARRAQNGASSDGLPARNRASGEERGGQDGPARKSASGEGGAARKSASGEGGAARNGASSGERGGDGASGGERGGEDRPARKSASGEGLPLSRPEPMAPGGVPGGGPPGANTVKAMVQDYHLALVPRMLADLSPETRIAHFSHTPWAPPDYYRMLPDRVAQEVLEGILGSDHAGFLSRRWADAFCDCCEEILGAEVDRARQLVSYRGHVTGIGVHPLGVDAGALTSRASQPDVLASKATLAQHARGRKLIVRIDRTELSKNIVRGLAAYRELLTRHPEWRGRVIHVAFAYPSRYDLPEYREYTASVQRMASEISEEFGTEDWDPLLLRVDDDYARSLAAYRLADVLLVNPIRDGMNLVAKEGPILSDGGCALVLSQETGAAAELAPHALMVNPFDVSATADALHEALRMPDSERKRRAASLAKAASALPPAQWFAGQLAALDEPATARS